MSTRFALESSYLALRDAARKQQLLILVDSADSGLDESEF
jgi:hypothetical protein